MKCGRCKEDVVAGSASCPHCGAKFVKRPAAPAVAPAPAEPAKSESDQMWGDEPQAKTVEAPPGAPRPSARPPVARRGRVINTGRPSTVGTNILADNAKTLGSVAIAVLVIVGFGIRVWLRSSARSGGTAGWQVLVDKDFTLGPEEEQGGVVTSDITKGTYILEVTVKEGVAGMAMSPISSPDLKESDIAALAKTVKLVEKGRTDVISGSLTEKHYGWVVVNTDEKNRARVHITLKGGGR